MKTLHPIFVAFRAFCGQSSFALCAMLLALCGAASAQTWIIDGQQVQTLNLNVSDPQALYTDGSREMTAPVTLTQSATAANGALQIYASDSGEHMGFFKTLSFQDGLQFSTAHSPSLFFGMSANDGLLIGPDRIQQFGYNARIEFETGTLTGVAGAKQWRVDADPTDASGIVSRGYADTRYLRSDIDLAAPLSFSSASTATSGLFRAYYEPEGQVVEFFIIDGDYECVRLGSAVPGLMVGGTYFGDGAIVMNGSGNRIYIEDGNLEGHWTVNNPTTSTEIVNRGYADSRYLMRTEGITTNRVIQAGDTLVISNGLITAINP